MNFFKKNKQKTNVVKTVGISFVKKMPTNSLELGYNTLMEEYKANPNEDTQRILQEISTELNRRAYEQGNGKLFKEIKRLTPSMTEDEFNIMSSTRKQNYKDYLTKMTEVDNLHKKINEPEPDIDVELDNYENEYGSVDRPDPTENEVIETPEEKTVLINEVKINEKPKKKIGLNFFKKKKLIHLPKDIDGDFVMKPLLKKEAQASVNLDHDPNMQTMSEPPKKEKESIFKKTLFTKKDQVGGSTEDLLKNMGKKKEKEKLPDLLCPDCTHSIKAHQTKGESTGCKCGCLNTIDQIKEKHNVPLIEPPLGVTADAVGKATEHAKEQQSEVELKQAQQMASMKSQPKPTEIPTEPKQPLERSLCANCDHIPKAHFEGTKFCTVIGCTCETYRAYPE